MVQVMRSVLASSVVLVAGGRGQEAAKPTPQQPREAPPDQELAAKGKALHSAILDRHPKIDGFYREPSLWGAASPDPLAVITVPESDWATLAPDEIEALKAYASSQVNGVRSAPLAKSGIPATAPGAPLVRQNATLMGASSWGIMVGRISDDGRDILSDRVATRGR
jgi:hypothetical protein